MALRFSEGSLDFLDKGVNVRGEGSGYLPILDLDKGLVTENAVARSLSGLCTLLWIRNR